MNQHDFNQLLIEFVREEEVLYQSQNLNFTNSAERHMAYERIAEKLRQHGASFDQTHRLNEKFLKLKWRYMKEHQQVETHKRLPSWPYYESLSFLLPSVLELERKRLSSSEDGQSREHPPAPQPLASAPPPPPPQQFVEVQTCEVLPSSSANGTKGRTAQKRKNVMMEETDTRLMEKRRITNQAFAEFVACKLDEMPEPIRTYTERQIIDVVMSVHVETYQEISQSGVSQLHHAADRDLPIAADVYHPSQLPDQAFDHCAPLAASQGHMPKKSPRSPAKATASPSSATRKRNASKDESPEKRLRSSRHSDSQPGPSGSSDLQKRVAQLEQEREQHETQLEELRAKLGQVEGELQKAENSKRVLYKALVRERNLNGEKPSVLMSEASKTGHNFCKPYGALSPERRHERIRLLGEVLAEFADPKGNSADKRKDLEELVQDLQKHLDDDPLAFK